MDGHEATRKINKFVWMFLLLQFLPILKIKKNNYPGKLDASII